MAATVDELAGRAAQALTELAETAAPIEEEWQYVADLVIAWSARLAAVGANRTAEAAEPASGTAAPAAPVKGTGPSAQLAGVTIWNTTEVEPTEGQLESFTLFEPKDPFVQQVDPNAAPPGSASGRPQPAAQPAPAAAAPKPATAGSSAGQPTQARPKHQGNAGRTALQQGSYRADRCAHGVSRAHTSIPAMEADVKAARLPAIMALSPNRAISPRRSGARPPMPPIWIAIDEKLAKPSSA